MSEVSMVISQRRLRHLERVAQDAVAGRLGNGGLDLELELVESDTEHFWLTGRVAELKRLPRLQEAFRFADLDEARAEFALTGGEGAAYRTRCLERLRNEVVRSVPLPLQRDLRAAEEAGDRTRLERAQRAVLGWRP